MNGILINQTIDLTKANILGVLQGTTIEELFGTAYVTQEAFEQANTQTSNRLTNIETNKANTSAVNTIANRVASLEANKLTLDDYLIYESVTTN